MPLLSRVFAGNPASVAWVTGVTVSTNAVSLDAGVTDVTWPDLSSVILIRGIRIHDNAVGRRPFVTLPSTIAIDGSLVPAVSFDDLLIQDAVRRAVLRQYQRRKHK